MDLLPRDAELARRAAGGDGAAFVRLYDHYSTEVFTASLKATGSIEAAATATQTAFLRVLRWPPALGAPDGDVAELLCALALGGSSRERTNGNGDTADARDVARRVGVGWLRSETVAKGGARFDADWSEHLWTAPPAEPEPDAAEDVAPGRPRRKRGWLERISLPLPSPAPAAAALVLLLFVGAAGTIATSGGTGSMETSPAASESAVEANAGEKQRPLRTRRGKRRPAGTRLLRDNTVQPLLVP
jgi:hypothetical protein